MNILRVVRRLVALALLPLLIYGCGMFGVSMHGHGNVGSALGVSGSLSRGINWGVGLTNSQVFGISNYYVSTGHLSGLSPGRFAGRVVQSLVQQGNAPKPKQLTSQQHYYLGRGVSAAVVDEFTMANLDNPKVMVQVEYLNGMAGYIYNTAPDGSSLWAGIQVGILENNTVAAYAAPGGFVWITRGAINMCQSEDELAALVAHELGHMAMEHSVAAYHQDNGGKVRLDVALLDAAAASAGEFNGQLGSYVKDHARRVKDDPYTEDQEYQADQWAAITLQQAGYSHTAMYRLLERVKAWEKANPTGSKYLKNHPPVDKRLSSLKDFTKEHEELFKLKISAEATVKQNARFAATFRVG